MRPILRLTEKQRQLYALIVERPRNAEQLFALAYWLHPQDAHVSVIKAHINQINRKLCYRGQCITAERGEPYRIVRIKPHGYPKRKPALNPHNSGVEGTQSANTTRQHR